MISVGIYVLVWFVFEMIVKMLIDLQFCVCICGSVIIIYVDIGMWDQVDIQFIGVVIGIEGVLICYGNCGVIMFRVQNQWGMCICCYCEQVIGDVLCVIVQNCDLQFVSWIQIDCGCFV